MYSPSAGQATEDGMNDDQDNLPSKERMTMKNMTKVHMRIMVVIAGLCAVFFITSATADDVSSSLKGGLNNSKESTILLAKENNQETKRSMGGYTDILVKMMDEVFRVLNTIYTDEGISDDEKQEKAIEFLRNFRYGPNNKDYFWLTDLQGKVLMDPYLPDLVGKDLMNFIDPDGIMVFQELIRICREQGEGFLGHLWPKYEQKHRHYPKKSFARLFKPWDWIVYTGVYPLTIETFPRPPILDDRQPASPFGAG